MLYVTSRNHHNTFTAHQALMLGRADDGGLLEPLHLPRFSQQEISRFTELSFGQCVAEMLNLFFCTQLTGWDVDFCIGRYPVRAHQLANRIVMAETWHNLDWKYQRLERNLSELLAAKTDVSGNWVSVAVRMAVLAGILGSRETDGTGLCDISAVSGDFTVPFSAWYLRRMGFPIGNIICCCNENNQFWELICNGQMRTAGLTVNTMVPEADISLPVNLERFLSGSIGTAEARRFIDCCEMGAVYTVSDAALQVLRQELSVSVISSNRLEATIPNVYKTHRYLLSPAAALAYSGLLDYRAKTGISRTAVVLCDQSPVCSAETVAGAMDIPVEELKKLL